MPELMIEISDDFYKHLYRCFVRFKHVLFLVRIFITSRHSTTFYNVSTSKIYMESIWDFNLEDMKIYNDETKISVFSYQRPFGNPRKASRCHSQLEGPNTALGAPPSQLNRLEWTTHSRWNTENHGSHTFRQFQRDLTTSMMVCDILASVTFFFIPFRTPQIESN